MGRAKQRSDRIRAEVPIARVLADYGYHVNPDGGDREQQFSCDLHGDGRDSKPSARAYPTSNSWYCWACGRPRDAIQTAREKEGLDFWTAVKVLEGRYQLPQLPWDDDDEEAPREKTISERVRDSLRSEHTFEEERARVERLLQSTTDEREVEMRKVLALWETFDRVCCGVAQEGWAEEKGKSALLDIRERALALITGSPS